MSADFQGDARPFRNDSESSFGSLTLHGRELQTETKMFDQAKLRFYESNPRIYSIVRAGESSPSQDDIFEKLSDLEHVRELVLNIKENGGLIEPLLIKPETLEVLEGNSRLAAYRRLCTENPIKWGRVKSTFLPAGMTDREIFSLLAEYHINGKKDWSPYEQAGFIYRRYKEHGLNVAAIAKESCLKQADAKNYIDTYDFMLQHDNDSSKWSYYFEFIKSRKIKKLRESFPGFDRLIVDKIATGEIKKAVDVRDGLMRISDGPARVCEKFASGQLSFDDTLERLADSGADNSIYRRLNKFRQWVVDDDVRKSIKSATPEERKRILFELEKILARTKALTSEL
jgi:hypothetical protein